MFGWKHFTGVVNKTVLIEGDPAIPRTQWWNHLIVRFLWKKIAVISVTREANLFGYYVGFRNTDGNAMVSTRLLTVRQFIVRIGHEDCEFFAMNTEGQCIEVHVEAVTTKDRLHYHDGPLL